MANYDNLAFTREELSTAMRHGYDRIISFITTPEFKSLHQELRSLSPQNRPQFVQNVILKPTELARRGVVLPYDVLIQTSAFGDRRPTLFAVRVILPPRFHEAWVNVNYTFDNEYLDSDVTRDPQKAWRDPLPVALQNRLLSQGVELESADPVLSSR